MNHARDVTDVHLDECCFYVADAANSPWMVFEFIPHGDLAEVLRSNSRQFWKPVPGLAPLTKVRHFGPEKWKILVKGCYTKQQPKFGTESRTCTHQKHKEFYMLS